MVNTKVDLVNKILEITGAYYAKDKIQNTVEEFISNINSNVKK